MLGKKDFLSGGYIFNWNMVRRLVEDGDEVDVIHFRTVPDGLPDNPIHAGLHVCRRILRFDPDVLIVSKSYHYAGPFRLIQPLTGIPVVYLMHHMEWMDHPGRISSGMYRGYVRWLLGMADSVWVNSASTFRGVAGTGIPEELIHVIPPGFIKDTAPVPDRSSRKGPARLLCVGSIARRKAQDVLVRACALLDRGTFSLELAGNMDNGDGYSEEMKEMVAALDMQDSVKFLDGLSPEELAEAYDGADILVQPSRWEAFGMAVVEGMWRGLPVIATDVAALPELVDHGVNGLLVPPDDPVELASALARLAGDRNMRLTMGRESRTIAEGMNDWGVTGSEFIELVHRTAGGGSDAWE